MTHSFVARRPASNGALYLGVTPRVYSRTGPPRPTVVWLEDVVVEDVPTVFEPWVVVDVVVVVELLVWLVLVVLVVLVVVVLLVVGELVPDVVEVVVVVLVVLVLEVVVGGATVNTQASAVKVYAVPPFTTAKEGSAAAFTPE